MFPRIRECRSSSDKVFVFLQLFQLIFSKLKYLLYIQCHAKWVFTNTSFSCSSNLQEPSAERCKRFSSFTFVRSL